MTLYTDGVHVVADSLDELHTFARDVGLSRSRYHGVRKGHPHYDLTKSVSLGCVLTHGAVQVTARELLLISRGLTE